MNSYRLDDYVLYKIGTDAWLLVALRPGPGRPVETLILDSAAIELVRGALVAERQLFSTPAGGFALVPKGGRPVPYQSLGALEVGLGRWVQAATAQEALPGAPALPTNAGELAGSELARAICAANRWRLTRWAVVPTGRLDYLSTNGTPEYFGALRHPVVGDAADWFPPPEPAAPGAYPHLRALFSGVPLAPAGHVRLHAYLLSAFAADSLTSASPLLVVDSAAQSQGKSQITNALQQVLDGEQGRIGYAPVNAADSVNSHDTFVAYFMAGGRVLNLDNLETQRRWNAPWIASLLTSRNAAARAKYGRRTENFKGKLVTLNLVLGEAWLHPDLVSRTWRVPIRADAPVYFHDTPVPEEYAVAHTEALRAECYWAVKRSLAGASDVKGGDRMVRARAIGLAAYAHVFGRPVAEVEALLAARQDDKRGLTAEFLVIASREKLWTGQGPSGGSASLAGVLGAEGFGHEVVRRGTTDVVAPLAKEVS